MPPKRVAVPDAKLAQMKPAASGLDQAPGSLAHAMRQAIAGWPSDAPLTAIHLSGIMQLPEVTKALEGKTANAQSLVEAIAAQPPAFWKKWVADNVSGSAEKVTRQTAKPQGKAAAAGGDGTPTSDLRKRTLELDFKQEDIDKMSDDEVKFNVESVEAATAKAKSKDAELAEKRQAQRDENAARRQRISDKKAAAAEKKAAGKPAKQSTRSVGADKEVVSSGGESRSNVKDTPASAVDLDGLSVDELSQALAKARVRDAMGSSQNVGVQLGQPGSTFTDMASGSPNLAPLAGAGQAGDGSFVVGNFGASALLCSQWRHLARHTALRRRQPACLLNRQHRHRRRQSRSSRVLTLSAATRLAPIRRWTAPESQSWTVKAIPSWLTDGRGR